MECCRLLLERLDDDDGQQHHSEMTQLERE